MEAEPEFVADQLDAVFTDIYPDSVKIGMVSNSRIIRVIADKLLKYGAKNIVVDPVMVSTSGHRLMCEEAMDAVTDILLPMGDVITPNIPETQVLCGFEIHTEEDMIKAAGKLAEKYKGAINGSVEREWQILILMAQAVPFLQLLPAIWLLGFQWKTVWQMRKPILQVR